MRKEKKLSAKIKNFFQKKKPENNPLEGPKPTESEQEEVKKRLKSLGYFED